MIKFMKYYQLYFILSALVILPGLFALISWGLNPSIDFTGGTIMEIEVQNAQAGLSKETVLSLAAENGIEVESLETPTQDTYRIKAAPFNQETNSLLQEKIATTSAGTVVEKRFETLGPTLGAETLRRALTAIGFAAIGILLFVWNQFKDKKYGICAVLAMLHDTLVVFGIFAILGHFVGVEVDTLFMTAVLTILSFSVHDTIVVYDRIRESLRKLPSVPYKDVVNKAVNETLGRSVNNSMTIIFMLLALYLLGGETIKWFVLALLIGTISGTYSSTFTAAPLLVLWDKLAKKKR